MQIMCIVFIQDDDELGHSAWPPNLTPARASKMLGAFACFHDRMPRSDSAEAVDFFSERTAAAGAAPAGTAEIISTNHSLAREFSFAASVAKGKNRPARWCPYVDRRPSVRRPRRDLSGARLVRTFAEGCSSIYRN